MKTYTYSEARQSLARLLDEALSDSEVRIRRQDGTEFSVQPVTPTGSPLDVPGVESQVTARDILTAIREGRERD